MGVLHVVCGPAGVGKSTYGRQLAAQHRACFLDSDTVTEEVVRAGMLAAGMDPDDRDSPEYQAAFRAAVYECLFATAAENLPHVDVVVVGPFTREIRNAHWVRALSERFEAEVKVSFVICDGETRRQRIEKRANPRDVWKLKHWQEYLAQSSISPPVFDHQLVKT